MKRKILIATTVHPRSDPRVANKIGRSLIESNFQVDWLGPRKSGLALNLDINATTVPLLDTSDKASRLLSLKSFFRALRASIASYDWVYAPDPDAALLALFAAGKTQTRVWFDIHEDFHGASIKGWIGNQAGAMAGPVVKKCISEIAKRSDLVTAVSPTLLDSYVQSHEGFLLPNTVSVSWPNSLIPVRGLEGPGNLVIYAGKPGKFRGTPALLGALEILQQRRVRAVAVLHGSQKDLAQVVDEPIHPDLFSESSLAHVRFAPLMAHAEMKRTIASSTLVMVGYTGPAARASLPNRFFEALAMGIPVVVPSNSPHMVEIVYRYKCGYVCDFTSPTSIVEVLDLVDLDPDELVNRRSNARSAFFQDFAWEYFFEKLRPKLA